MNHLTFVVPHMRCNLVEMYHWLAEWQRREAKREITARIIDGLRLWESTLKKIKPDFLIPDAETVDVGWVGDTFTSYGIGVVIGKKWARFRLKRGWSDEDERGRQRGIAGAETVAARLGFLVLKELTDVRGRRFLMLTDNTVTENAVRNGRSADRMVNEEWRRIQEMILQEGSSVEPKRVRSEDNSADRLSRGLDPSKWRPDEIQISLPEDLRDLIVQE